MLTLRQENLWEEQKSEMGLQVYMLKGHLYIHIFIYRDGFELKLNLMVERKRIEGGVVEEERVVN